ncbi:MAG: hypothetical protein RIS54_659 [Verrucomicrobiota bacterium]|jgi:hypothetical protein
MRGIVRRCGRAVGDDLFARGVGPEGVGGEAAFFFAGETDRGGVADDPAFAPPPIELFFEMLARVGAGKPRVEHAVRKHEIRGASAAQRRAHRPARLPQALDQNRVESPMIPAQPRAQRGGIDPTQRMKRPVDRRPGADRICRGDFDTMPHRPQRCGGLHNGLRGSTGLAAQGVDHAQQFEGTIGVGHGGRRGEVVTGSGRGVKCIDPLATTPHTEARSCHTSPSSASLLLRSGRSLSRRTCPPKLLP